MYATEPTWPDFNLARRKRSSSARRRLKHSNANFVSECIVGKGRSIYVMDGRTCEFSLEDLRLCSLPFALA